METIKRLNAREYVITSGLLKGEIVLSDDTDAQMDNFRTDGDVAFYAPAYTKAGDRIGNVVWATVDGWDGDDTSIACDWENPLGIL